MAGEIDLLRIEESFITIQSNRLAMRWIYGRKHRTSPVLVFLHEGLGSIRMWRDIPEQLCTETGLTGVVYDRRGHGNSDPLPQHRTPGYLHEEALKYLPLFLEKNAIDKPLFIGHSDGGSIALLYTAHFPEKTVGVISEAAHVFLEDISITGIENAVEMYESGSLKKSLTKYHSDKTDAVFYGWAHTWLSPEFRDWNIVNELKSITAPSLIIQGTEDEYGTEKQVDAIVNNVSGESEKFMIPGCGHVPHFQARDLVTAKMIESIHTLNVE